MKRILAAAAFAAISAAAMAGEGWITSWAEAQKLAKKTGKPILMDFTGSDWCAPCKMLKRDVYDKPEFKKWAKANVVLLYLDFPQSKPLTPALQKQNDTLAARFQIRGYPTALFVSKDGKELGRLTGYGGGGHAKFIAAANGFLKKK